MDSNQFPNHSASGHDFSRATRDHSIQGLQPLRKLVLVGDHPCYFFLIRLVHHRIGIEMAFALGSLRSQNVALKSVSTLELARTCLLEALRRSTVCLKLWHSDLFILQQNPAADGGARKG